MITKLFRTVTRKSPDFRRLIWKWSYNYLAGTYGQGFWNFMNYGFAATSLGTAELVLEENDEADRFCIQLYHEVAGAIPLKGLDVLEVGSGRGGGASYVFRYLKPKTMTGVDFSGKAVRLCRKRHDIENLKFVEGDAENLPFPDGSFDAVINVESSHCYGSMQKFLSEVSRVLRPGGHFLFADLRGRGEAEDLHRFVASSGMTIEGHWDITANVLKALTLDNDRKQMLIEKIVQGPLLKYFKEFAGMKNTGVFERFQKGENVYLRYVLRKP